MGRILVVDDDPGVVAGLEHLLNAEGHQVTTALGADQAMERFESEPPELVILDAWMPRVSGLELFRWVKERHPGLPVMMMTGASTTDLAIEASKEGAFDYHLKPFEPGAILRAVNRALQSGAHRAPAAEGGAHTIEEREILGEGAGMLHVYRSIGRVAPTDAAVLIRGESGTGKELVAKAIHRHSLRSCGPLVIVNCVAIPETLLESELFGYEKGAFTGAATRRIGKFEHAHGGTLFLDEVGDLPQGIQAKILRVLQEKTFERIGGNATVQVDVRILAATHRNIEQDLAKGTFRNDLYHRLNVVTILLPPLRERPEDIDLLTQHFVARIARTLGVAPPAVTPEALEALRRHRWPGNVRELEHCLQRVMIMNQNPSIQADEVRVALQQETGGNSAATLADEETRLRAFVDAYLTAHTGSQPMERLLEAVDRLLVIEALERTGGNQSRAAALLGVPRPTLHARMQKHGIRVGATVQKGSAPPVRG